MCSGAAFLIGLVLLTRGAFRINNRTISKEYSRRIAMLLMLPLAIGLCAGTWLISGSPTLDMDTLQTAAMIELLALALAVGAVIYLIYSVPQTPYEPGMTFGGPSAPAAPQTPPDIMTTAEAAAYLRITEADVIALIEGGKLPAARINGSYRIARIAIDDYLFGNP